MIKREFKLNLKSFIIWLSILVSIFLLVFLVYPYIMNSTNMNAMDEIMKMFPSEVLKTFNMDIVSIDTAYGWLKTEGYIFIILLTGVFSAMLGSNILLKEESDKTIEFLYSKPITRNSIVNSKVICGSSYIVLLVLLLCLFNYFGLILSGSIDIALFLNISLAPIMSSLSLFFICLFISTFFHKTKKTVGISLAIVFVSYFLTIFASVSDSVKILKYFSVFSLADGRDIITSGCISIVSIIITLIIILISYFATLFIYNEKELA